MKTKRRSCQHGFTLMELLIVVAIIGILSAITIPNFISWLPRYRLDRASQEMMAAMIQARSTAARDFTWVVFQANAANTGFIAFRDGGDPAVDADGNGVPDGANDGLQGGTETTVVTVPLPSGITIAATFQISFDRRGFPNSAAAGPWNFTLQNEAGATRQVSLLPTGFAQII